MTTSTALDRLRAQARSATLFPPTSLADAMHRLGFVQADPIRAPARAQGGPPAGAVRPAGLGPAPVRAPVGLGLPVRGLHAPRATPVRLLRHADAVRRPGDRLGQRRPCRRADAGCNRLCPALPGQRQLPPRAGGRAGPDGAVPHDADHGVSGAWGRFSAAAMRELGHGAAAAPDPGGLVGRRVMV